METLGNNFGAKKSKKEQIEYYCKKCDVNCCKKFNWERHITTRKHTMEIIVNKMDIKMEQKEQKYLCKNEKGKYFMQKIHICDHK